MKYRWSIAPAQPALAEFLSRELEVSPLLAQCLLNRGFSEAPPIRRFLEPRLKDLADPFLLPNMRAAVERLFLARVRGESIVIFGDYDVDGVTSVTLLLEVLSALGWRVNCYLPHRMEEGYGLSRGASKIASKNIRRIFSLPWIAVRRPWRLFNSCASVALKSSCSIITR